MNQRTFRLTTALVAGATPLIVSLSSVSAIATPAQASATKAASQDARTTTIITKGDQEITRRLTALNKLSAVITSDKHLSTSDGVLLDTQVSSDIASLTSLKTKLDAETTIDGAKADVQSIISDYRVYALVLPKVHIVRLADDELAAESALTKVAGDLSAAITSAKAGGKDTSLLETQLAQLQSMVQATSANEQTQITKVINLQPSDYNSNHAALSGVAASLKADHANNVQSRDLAKTMQSELQKL